MRKRIMIINGYFFPARNYGGPSTSICNMVNALNSHFDFYIIAHNHDYGVQEKLQGVKQGWNEYCGAQVIYLDDADYRYENFVEYVKKLGISLIYNTGFYVRGIKNFLWLSRVTKVPVMVAPRGELNPGALQQKSIKKKLYLEFAKASQLYKNVYFHSTCTEEHKALLEILHISENNVFDATNFSTSLSVTTEYQSDGLKLKLLSLGRVCRIKNIIEAINGVKEAGIPVQYDIYGPIEDKEYYEECLKSASKAPKNVKICFCGNYDHETVGEIITKYDAMITITLSENFGQTIAESISTGCPVIVSKGTTEWDEIDGIAGYTVNLGDKDRLIAILQQLFQMTSEQRNALTRATKAYAAAKFNIEKLQATYINMFNAVVK